MINTIKIFFLGLILILLIGLIQEFTPIFDFITKNYDPQIAIIPAYLVIYYLGKIRTLDSLKDKGYLEADQ